MQEALKTRKELAQRLKRRNAGLLVQNDIVKASISV